MRIKIWIYSYTIEILTLENSSFQEGWKLIAEMMANGRIQMDTVRKIIVQKDES